MKNNLFFKYVFALLFVQISSFAQTKADRLLAQEKTDYTAKPNSFLAQTRTEYTTKPNGSFAQTKTDSLFTQEKTDYTTKPNGSFAQTKPDSSYSKEKPAYMRMIVKLIPLASIDFDNTWQFAIEHRLQKAWTLSEEFGYGRFSDNPWVYNSESNSKKETFRAKLEVRNYKIDSPFLIGKYIGYEAFYKQVNDVIDTTIPRECETGNCNYYEKLKYNVSKYVYGANIKFGKQGRFGPKTAPTNFVYDYFMGFGFRRIQINHKNDDLLNPNLYYNYRGDSGSFGGYGREDRSLTLPNITVGLKIGLIVF